ncbi:hypothetical protein ONZ45_g10851 [Pleurotus djamor]|nr:hypothetical protein ONZ45_g10851 [Pleurotus djamor]
MPDSPSPGSRNIESPPASPTFRFRYPSVRNPYQDFLLHRPLVFDDVEDITPRQVLVGYWHVLNQPRQSRLLLAKAWLTNTSKILVAKSRLDARESVVRLVSRVARIEHNAAKSNRLMEWASALSLDPDASIDPDESPDNIWHPVTPPRPTLATSSRNHAERFRAVIFSGEGDVGMIEEAAEDAKKRRRAASPAQLGEASVPAPIVQDHERATAGGAMNVDDIDILEHDLAVGDDAADGVDAPFLGPRMRRPTWKILQQRHASHPAPRTAAEQSTGSVPSPSPSSSDSTPLDPFESAFCTPPNQYGIFREYPTKPTHDPTSPLPSPPSVLPSTLPIAAPEQHSAAEDVDTQVKSPPNPWHPFSNRTTFELLKWQWTGSNHKSETEFKRLLHIFDSSDVDQADVHQLAQGYDAEIRRIDEYINSSPERPDITAPSGQAPSRSNSPEAVDPVTFSTPLKAAPWNESSIRVPVPDGKLHPSMDDVPHFTVDGLLHRSLVDMVKEIFSDPKSHHFHYTPFKEFHQTPGVHPSDNSSPKSRMYSEIFTSDAMLDAHIDLQRSPGEPGCTLEKVVAALMVYSDSTHLALFGTASAWPMYLFIGNQLKALRAKPRAGACHHLAYLPKVVRFVGALLATIRNLGTYERRRHTKARTDDSERQQRVNQARDGIYLKGVALGNKLIDMSLRSRSEIPTQNVFSKQLAQFGGDYFSLFVPDLMHEIELGTWKSLFVHLLRILHAQGGDSIQRLNESYRSVPLFGESTIRRFSNNASAMKKLAARDFEDLLQCSLPVFEGLLDDEGHDDEIQRLLYTFAEWHVLAKLRLHTEETLAALDHATQEIGRQLRRFENGLCNHYNTTELPSEEAARNRRRKTKGAVSMASGKRTKQPAKKKKGDDATTIGPKVKKFNMKTYKFHSMGDYTSAIQHFGTTDSYSTQMGELQHRFLKVFYIRTNKKRAARQMSKHEARMRLEHHVANNLHRLKGRPPVSTTKRSLTKRHRDLSQFEVSMLHSSPLYIPDEHHIIAKSQNDSRDLYALVGDNSEDGAFTVRGLHPCVTTVLSD